MRVFNLTFRDQTISLESLQSFHPWQTDVPSSIEKSLEEFHWQKSHDFVCRSSSSFLPSFFHKSSNVTCVLALTSLKLSNAMKSHGYLN